MTATYEEALFLKQSLETEYEGFHADCRRLRALWHGKFWDLPDDNRSSSVSSFFKDLTSRNSDIGPDIKLTYNLLKDVCVKFQTYLAPMPMIQMYVDPPSSAKRRKAANLKERFLYGTWSENRMVQLFADQGWYVPLMGNFFIGAYPDMKTNMVRTISRSPEFAYPVPSFDYGKTDAVVFCFKARLSAIQREYPSFEYAKSKSRSMFSRRSGETDPQLDILEYSDSQCFYRWCEGQYLQGTEHNFDFNLFEHVKFINVPGEAFGEGAVAQSVNLVEMGNAYLSLMMQSAIENVFPVMVLEDPAKAPEVIQRGPGAVIPVNQGGKVSYLQPPAGNLLAQADWAKTIEQMVKTDTSMPDVNFGQADNSIITGKAINELQGAGTGSLVDMVRGTSIGAALSSWNEKAIHIARNMFAEDPIRLYGQLHGSIADLNPQQFALNLTGKELTGSTRNEVVFMPHLDMHTKVVIGLQLAGAGIVSRAWQRNQIGIPDNEAMEEEIVEETIQDAVLQMLVQEITTPEDQAHVEADAVAVIEGRPVRAGAPQAPPPVRAGAPGGGGAALPEGGTPGPAFGSLPGGGQTVSPAMALPPGAPPPVGGPEGATAPPASPVSGNAGSEGSVTLNQAVQEMQNLEVDGQVFLVGEIVANGSTSKPVDVRITEAGDREAVSHVSFQTSVKVISGEPQESHIEVTPGSAPVQGGDTEGV